MLRCADTKGLCLPQLRPQWLWGQDTHPGGIQAQGQAWLYCRAGVGRMEAEGLYVTWPAGP